MTPEDPGLTFSIEFYQGKRLWIMDDHHIVINMGEDGKPAIDFQVDLLFHGRKIYGLALESIMKFFGNGEEIGITMEDPPSKGDSQFVEDDDHAVE
jgi:hypothetical protein